MKRLAAVAAAILACASSAWAKPVLHEYFEPAGDAESGAPAQAPRLPDGVPAGIGQAPSTQAASYGPDTSLPGTAVDDAGPAPITEYGGASAAARGYQLDANTTMPSSVAYDDPFSPAMPPFKRLFAFDTVDASFVLAVADGRWREVAKGATPGLGEDQFFAELTLVVDGSHQVRLPTVGPGTRLVAAELDPPVPVRIVQDSADNWFGLIGTPGRYRLIMHLAIERSVFGSPYEAESWAELSPHVPALSAEVAAAAAPVLAAIGVSRGFAPAEAVAKLVHYFRGFAPTGIPRSALSAAQLYRDVALMKVGVCRHRAFAFVVTALALGVPARFVHNEAHAWVEVRDAQSWHRVDLGGAAGEMALATRVDVRHSPPRDPYAWPAAAQSGTEMADAALSGAGGPGGRASPLPDSPAASAQAAATSPTTGAPQPSAPGAAEPLPEVEPTARLALKLGAVSALRGRVLQLSGEASNGAGPCVLVPVAIYLEQAGLSLRIGTLATDGAGRYGGAVTLPAEVPLGDYEVVARTDAASACGAAEAR